MLYEKVKDKFQGTSRWKWRARAQTVVSDSNGERMEQQEMCVSTWLVREMADMSSSHDVILATSDRPSIQAQGKQASLSVQAKSPLARIAHQWRRD